MRHVGFFCIFNLVGVLFLDFCIPVKLADYGIQLKLPTYFFTNFLPFILFTRTTSLFHRLDFAYIWDLILGTDNQTLQERQLFLIRVYPSPSRNFLKPFLPSQFQSISSTNSSPLHLSISFPSPLSNCLELESKHAILIPAIFKSHRSTQKAYVTS